MPVSIAFIDGIINTQARLSIVLMLFAIIHAGLTVCYYFTADKPRATLCSMLNSYWSVYSFGDILFTVRLLLQNAHLLRVRPSDLCIVTKRKNRLFIFL